MLPSATNRAQIRLPYRLSWYGSGCTEHDTLQGECDYNPFAFNVGNLGRVLWAEYQINSLTSTAVLCPNDLSTFDAPNTYARAVSG
jgi:hypothetical protein